MTTLDHEYQTLSQDVGVGCRGGQCQTPRMGREVRVTLFLYDQQPAECRIRPPTKEALYDQ